MLDAHIAFLIAKKDSMRTFRTPGLYLAYILACSVISFYAWFFSSMQSASGISASGAFSVISLLSAAVVYSLYMAVSSVSSVARERQERTLEALFYGPVDEESFIAGKYLGRMISYLALAIATVAYVALLGLAIGAGPGTDLMIYTVLTLFLVSCVVALGIMLSNLTGNVTGSVFILVVFLLGMFVIKVLGVLFAFLLPLNPALSFAKDVVYALVNATQYISPVEYLGVGLDAAASNDPERYMMAFLYPVVYTIAMLTLSIYILKNKGVASR